MNIEGIKLTPLEKKIEEKIEEGIAEYAGLLLRTTYIRKADVCKHYIKGRCKKGNKCEYIHQLDLARMQKCHFGDECTNPRCMYRHIDVDLKYSSACIAFSQGFCKNGSKCTRDHIKSMPCPLYMAGFCPEGPNCEYGHPKFFKKQFCTRCCQLGHFESQCARDKSHYTPVIFTDTALEKLSG
ncbi:hypothetical protein ADUPG1_006415 [Aduncisulcus paluster]|uniref:C3H1-type domain-containing protein n=1 Tax=Aduncisulcus paluster TaxID=2918883 RepID=A0ABQ5KI70_9EUKA|nr:hypothetical protein ADUPG1_006415 [Aduncisulcus paluster]